MGVLESGLFVGEPFTSLSIITKWTPYFIGD